MQESVSQPVDEVDGRVNERETAPAGQVRSWSLRRLLLGTGGVFLVWLLLTASLHPQELLAGLAVALLVTLLSLNQLYLLDDIRLSPLLPWHLSRFLLSFLLTLLRANIDMARRVLSPRLPVCPGVVEARTELASPLGRLLLANAITLTPGTLSVDIVEDRLIIHWIDVSPGTDIDRTTALIVAGFERHLKRLLR